ncbi:hypothetical protein B0T16DRAFT_451511 [Cercophora newfieldiana]|uniref:Uncharacterized protein n=1 Tax=Cercophora newfieldiana TaxID=92897 RepID=A0AA39YPX2_9PEZI|nr:hypothetical protein B0T16DRAFT_451511 [Cercophora newfieldiana]
MEEEQGAHEEEQLDADLDLPPPPPSHNVVYISYHTPLPASALLDRELTRKQTLWDTGNILTGCVELDEDVLLGGLERGSVVGISAEDEDVGLRIGLQTVAHLLVSKPGARVRIVTTLAPVALLPKLREVIASRIVEVHGAVEKVREVVYGHFERISISRVFDFEGLWDVVAELDADGAERASEGVVVDHVPEVVAVETTPSSGGGTALEGSLPIRTGSEPQKGLEVVTEEEPAAESCHEPPPYPRTDDLNQTSTAMSNPDSSPLSSPPTSPVDPREEASVTLPEIRPLPERIPMTTHTRKAEILDSEDVPDSIPPDSSPLSSPPPSSPAISPPEDVALPRSERLPSEIPDSETESLDSEPSALEESSIQATASFEAGSPEPEFPEPLEQSSPESAPPDVHLPVPTPKYIPPAAEHTAPDQTAPDQTHTNREDTPAKPTIPSPPPLPDLILTTHTSTLLNTLFTGRHKPTAHGKMSHLSSQLHHLTRSPAHGNPLILLLNSTTSSFTPEPAANRNHYFPADMSRPPMPREADPSERMRNIPELTLRSVFGVSPGVAARREQRVKPSFGGVFAQMLDVHLLCTRVPRGIDGGFVWVAEVLLDRVGVYEGVEKGDGLRRRCREQRWGALEVDGGGRVVGAFR